eukprot:CAMPEP_0116063854 /NCGR_PEP_ID=MMETSP0322-20121206/8705_1 /TAXON_ID=163516 /ORGANISM="Leptocylindrus danicus var. apora, Strain B651" /LENGTH=43 /DNA_ID= /DNA_START= /DNA_END= /DNA_ORIENTATION=
MHIDPLEKYAKHFDYAATAVTDASFLSSTPMAVLLDSIITCTM